MPCGRIAQSVGKAWKRLEKLGNSLDKEKIGPVLWRPYVLIGQLNDYLYDLSVVLDRLTLPSLNAPSEWPSSCSLSSFDQSVRASSYVPIRSPAFPSNDPPNGAEHSTGR